MQYRPLNVASWNVMSWNTLVNKISNQAGSVGSWLGRHKFDILCLQETKVSIESLATDPKFFIPGYDLYSAPNRSSHCKGNGVATLVNRATAPEVEGVDFAPFGIPDLDSEGRCLVTLHVGGLAMINVYVPNDRNPTRLPHKMFFLNEITNLLFRLKQARRRVVLLGDFNIIHRPADVYWQRRLININILSSGSEILKNRVPAKIESDVRQLLPSVIPYKVENSTYQFLNQWSLHFDPNAALKHNTWIDHIFWTESEAKVALSLDETVAEGHVYKEKDRIPAFVLFDLLEKKLSIKFTEKEQKQVAETFGEACGSPASVRWLDETCEKFRLVDVHAKFHGKAKDRFTVWDMMRKDRNVNRGFRLDFILVDYEIPVTLGGPLPLVSHEAEAAEDCAIQTDPDFEFSSPVRTGFTYTPVCYSDHIPITAVIDPRPIGETVETEYTLKCKNMFKLVAVEANC